MSLLRTAQFGAVRDDPDRQTPQESALPQIVRLIPSEALAFFTGAIAFCVGVGWGFGPRLGILIGVVVATPFWVFFSRWGSMTEKQKKEWTLRHLPFWDMGIGIAAFVLWAATVPDTPFLEWSTWDLQFAPFVTLIGAAILVIFDKLHSIWRERRELHGQPVHQA